MFTMCKTLSNLWTVYAEQSTYMVSESGSDVYMGMVLSCFITHISYIAQEQALMHLLDTMYIINPRMRYQNCHYFSIQFNCLNHSSAQLMHVNKR